jgi:flagellar hook-associated protein 3 FlgL
MRIATRTVYQSMQERIMQLSGEMQNLNEKVASGKNLNRPSDDPIALIDSMQLKTGLAQFNQYARNIQIAKSWSDTSESAISQTVDLVGRAQEIATQMASDTQNTQTRASAAVEVGHVLDQVIALANSTTNGQYVFAGYQTHTVPFSEATVGGFDTAQYHGDTQDFGVQIGPNETIAAGRNGQTVFMDSQLFDTLGNLKKALEDNNTAAISQQLGNLQTAGDFFNSQSADIGARGNRLDDRQKILDQTISNFQTGLSDTEDADISQLMIDLNSKQLAYQAALYSAAKVNQLSLLDYVK